VFYYWAYGLLVESELCFPELLPVQAPEKSDVRIVFGSVPLINTKEGDFVSDRLAITPVAYRLEMEGVAVYGAFNGDTILVDPASGHESSALRLFCLSNVFAALLHQRKVIPLHCSAILYEDRLVLIFGESGAGKSTALASLIQRGFGPFSDDVCVPYIDEQGVVQCFSSYPMLKYWGSTAAQFRLNETQQGHLLRQGIDKYGYYFHDRFITRPKQPSLVFFLEKDCLVAAPTITPIKGIEHFKRLDEHAYRSAYLVYAGLRMEHFRLLTALSNQAGAWMLRRGEQANSIDLVADLIEAKIRQSL
jgi:hypothetical protein